MVAMVFVVFMYFYILRIVDLSPTLQKQWASYVSKGICKVLLSAIGLEIFVITFTSSDSMSAAHPYCKHYCTSCLHKDIFIVSFHDIFV